MRLAQQHVLKTTKTAFEAYEKSLVIYCSQSSSRSTTTRSRLTATSTSMTATEDANLELLTLIWLDQMADTKAENRVVQEKLRAEINYLRTFDNCQSCEDYIRNTIDDRQEKVILIVSGRLGRGMTEQVHDLKQVISIFVYCFDKQNNEIWAKKYPKVRGVIVKLVDLLQEIDRERRSDEQKLNESMDVFASEDPILPFLLQIKLSLRDKRDFLKICAEQYRANQSELEHIGDFEHLYSPADALDYFFNETFLYRLLLKSLHTSNVVLLYLLRFFLQDIEAQLRTRPVISGKVYRGQLLTTDQVYILTQSTEKCFVRFNTYVTASLNQDQVRQSLQSSPNAKSLQRVLFEIDDPNGIGRQYKQHCIFPITTTFRVDSIRSEQRTWIVRLHANNHDKQCELRAERTPIALAHHLRETNQLDQSEKLFELLLTQYSSLKAQCYDGLGRVAQERSFYDLSLSFYFESLQTASQRDRAHCLNNIACAYDCLECPEQALDFYSQALSLMETELDQSMCLNNMAITYAKNDQAEQALKCFQRALDIRKRVVPENHAEVGICYANIGLVHSSLGQEDDALENYNLALKALASNKLFRVPRAVLYQNMAGIYQAKGQIDQALKFYQHAQEIFQQARSPDHPNLLYIRQQLEQIKQPT